MTYSFLTAVTSAILAGLALAAPAAAQEASASGSDSAVRRVELIPDDFGVHTLDGLEEMSQPGPASLPDVLGTVTFGVTVPLDRRFSVGGETMWRAGYAVADGWYLGGGFGMVVFEGEPFRAFPEGTLFQFQGLVTLDWIYPLRDSLDPYGKAPAFRCSIAPGFVGGEYQERRSDKQRLRELNQQLETSMWGGVVRVEAGFDLPLLEYERRSLFLSFGLTYQWGLAQGNFKLRDKNGVNPTNDDTESIRLDAFSAWIGLTARF